jgi:methyl-accepting chemotaxis protein
MENKMTLRKQLLILTVGLNFISFVFCGFMMTQVKGALNLYLLIAALTILVGFGIYSFLFINRIGQFISKVITKMFDESQQMQTSVKDISDASNRLAQATTEQASALQETAASIEEMNAMIKKSAEGSSRSKDVAVKSCEVASRGKHSVDEMTAAIADIYRSQSEIMKSIDESHHEFSEIVKIITEIGSKTKIINDIVFQTKLLSFNASVEAARAGEHGKGFAVVAEEVGNLAQMSGQAAKEISAMLEMSVHKVQDIVNGTKEKVGGLILQGRRKVEVGEAVARTCGEVLEEVVHHVSNLSVMVDEISTAAQEQAQGIAEITRAINQLDQVTHSNAITSQQTASSAIQLDAQTTSTLSLIDELHDVVHAHHIHVKAPTAKVTVAKKIAKVYEIPRRRQKIETSKLPLASGGEEIPSQDDPRFEDF